MKKLKQNLSIGFKVESISSTSPGGDGKLAKAASVTYSTTYTAVEKNPFTSSQPAIKKTTRHSEKTITADKLRYKYAYSGWDVMGIYESARSPFYTIVYQVTGRGNTRLQVTYDLQNKRYVDAYATVVLTPNEYRKKAIQSILNDI